MKFLRELAAIATLALSTPAANLGYFSQNDAGQEVFSFLSTFDSPRNASLEKSAAAHPSTDPTVTQLNPAALILSEGKQRVISAHWQTGAFADNQGSLYYTTKYRQFLLQVSYNWLSYGDIDGYDEYGEETGKTYTPFSQLTTATIAFPMKHFRFGATLKFASDKLTNDAGDRAAFGAAFDWGLLWQSDSKKYGFAFTARDFGCILRDYVDDGSDEHYPMAQAFAISGYMRPSNLPRLTLYGESEFPRYAEASLKLGSSYALGKSFQLRIGFTRTWLDIFRDLRELASSADRPDETNKAHMLSFGLGYASDLFALDYAFSYLAQDLGVEHRIGLRLEF